MHYDNFTPNNLLMIRSFGLFLLVFSYYKIKGIELPRLEMLIEHKWIFSRSLFNYLGFITWVVGLNYFRFSTMICFSSLSPIFVLIFSIFILKETFRIRYLIGLVICLLGTILIILNDTKSVPTSSTQEALVNDFKFDNVIGLSLGLSHSILIALMYIGMKICINLNIDNDVQIYFLGLTNFFLGIIFMIFLGGLKKAFEITLGIIYMTNSILFYIAIKIQQISLKNIDLIKVTTVAYLSTIQAFFLGVLFLHDIIGVTDIIGSLLVLSFNVYNAYYPV